MQIRAAFLRVEAEYKGVTDREKSEVQGLGGLHVVGTERHESRRIDNQLRGRSGRQGDPGSTRYFLSLEVRNGGAAGAGCAACGRLACRAWPAPGGVACPWPAAP